MDRADAERTLRALHAAQNAMYSGGDTDAVRALLTEDVVWHIPGESAIAGSYRGIDQVIAYFEKRRALASNTMRLHPGEILVGEEHVAALTDGTAAVAGVEHRWSTLGLYKLRERRIAACWLLALDQAAFDRVWRAPPRRAG